jgi:signal peptidase
MHVGEDSMKKAAKWLSYIFLGLVIGSVLFAVLLPTVFSGRLAMVRSASMGQAMPVGALAVVLPVDAEDVKVDDIIVFKPPRDPTVMNPDVTVSHRVIEVQADGELYFITKGDAVKDPDLFPIPATNVQGKVVFNIAHLGYAAYSVMRYARTWLGFVLLVCIPMLVLVASAIRDVNLSRNVRLRRLNRRRERQRRWRRRRVFGLA